jgi:hypothetical protein
MKIIHAELVGYEMLDSSSERSAYNAALIRKRGWIECFDNCVLALESCYESRHVIICSFFVVNFLVIRSARCVFATAGAGNGRNREARSKK